jgi:hypothetical protein
MTTPGLQLDTFGRVTHPAPHKLGNEELLSVCQLHGLPLGAHLGREIYTRGLRLQLARLFEAERMLTSQEDH